MRTMISGVLILILWGAAPALAQLPPEIQADSYLLRAEQAIDEGDQARARDEIDKIIFLQKEHELDLPDAFHFRYAKAAFATDLSEQAHEAVVKYLNLTGREGKYYQEALELMNQVRDAIAEDKGPQRASNKPSPPVQAAELDPVAAQVAAGGPPEVQEAKQALLKSDGRADGQAEPGCDLQKWRSVGFFMMATVQHLKACLEAGADPNARDEDKERPLHWAAGLNENPAVVHALLDAGADPKTRDEDKWTPLHWAAASNENVAVTEALIAAGANLDAPDEDGDRPLNLADVYNKNPAVSKALISAGANLKAREKYKWTPLHREAKFNADPAVIVALISAGADPQARDKYKRTPLHEAASSNDNPDVIESLISAGANLEARDNNKLRPLHAAASSNDNPDVIKALIAAGADLNARGGFFLRIHYTPLHYAATRSSNNLAIVEALLNAGADPNARTVFGTSLHLAAANAEDPAVIEALLDAGGDLSKQDSRFSGKATPLHDAAEYNDNPAVIRFLLDAGADLKARDKKGYTPLALAAENNDNPAVVKALLEAGADLKAQTNKGFTPLALATENNDNPTVRDVLLAAGAGQVERQLAAERARREAQSGPGFLEAAIGIAGGTAIAAAGGGTDEALEAGALFAEGVIGGTSPRGSTAGVPVTASTGNVGSGTGGGSCEVPGYPRPANPQGLGLSWCPASVDFQVRVFALTAAGAKCAITLGNSSTPDQVRARRSEIEGYCERLAALDGRLVGNGQCLCPEGYPDRTDFVAAPAVSRVKDSVEEARRQREEARRQREEEAERQRQAAQAAERERLRIEGRNRSVLDSDCTCISIDERTGEYSCSDGFVSAPDSKKPLCDILRR